MFSVEQIKSQKNYQEIVTKEWTDCKDSDPKSLCFALYNGNKEALGFAALDQNDLSACFTCFSLEPFSNQEALRDFFFKGILGILSLRGIFFIDAKEPCKSLMKEFQFETHAEIESLLKGSCSHDS